MDGGKWISEVANGYGTTLEITEHLFSTKSAFQQIDIYQTMEIGEEMKKAFADTYNILANMSASDICIQYFLSNIFVSTFLAPLTAFVVYKK